MDDLKTVEAKRRRVQKQIVERVDMQRVEPLCGVPGVDMITARTL
jgi:hypothetical protein